MFCRNCGNQLGNNDLFCNKCGAKQVSINSESNIRNSNNKKQSFSVINLIILLMFLVYVATLCMSIMFSGVESMRRAPSGSTNGLMLIGIFIIACICIIPQIVGSILSIVNMFLKKQIISVFIFVVSVISLISIIIYYSWGILTGGVGLNLLLNIGISIMALIKMVTK